MVEPHSAVPVGDPLRDEFRSALGLQPIETLSFDDALGTWIVGHARASGEPSSVGAPEPELVATAGERIQSAVEAAPGDRMRLYHWALLLKHQDRLLSSAYGNPVTGPLLRRHLDLAALRAPLGPDEFIALLGYFADAWDSPSGDLVPRVWDAARSSELLEHGDARDALGAWTVQLVGRRAFHYELQSLLTVLDWVRDSDRSTISALRQLTAANGQGAALIVEVLLRRLDVARLADGSSAAAETTRWLISARGAKPTAGWNEQRQRLDDELGAKLLTALAKGILRRSEHRRHAETGRRDELFWSMWKSACWYLGQDPGAAADQF